MFDPAPAPMTGVRRHDLRRAGSGRAPVTPPEPGSAGLADSIDRQLATGRHQRLPVAVLAMALRSCRHTDGRPAPELLQRLVLEAGQRLRGRVRGTDTVLWPGGAEFAVVLIDCRHDMAQAVQRRLLAGLGEPYRLGTDRVVASLACGCACHPAAGESGAQLLAAAQLARGPLDGE